MSNFFAPSRAVPGRPSVFGVDGLCGAGKTHAASEHIAAGVLGGERFIIAGPTSHQSERFAASVRDATVRLAGRHDRLHQMRCAYAINAINRETIREPLRGQMPLSVTNAVMDQIAHAETTGRGHAICITHAALRHLPLHARPRGWHLIIDESPLALEAVETTLPGAYWGELDFGEPDQAGRALLTTSATRLDDLLRVAREAEDEVLARTLRTLHQRIKSGEWRVHALAGDLANVAQTGSDPAQVVLTYLLDWFTFLGKDQPIWASVTLMAANLRDSFAGQTLLRQGINLVEHPVITPKLRFRQHPNGDVLDLYYLTERNASKQMRNSKMPDGRIWREHAVELITAKFAGKQFGWAANLEVPDTALSGERLPFTCHGLNEYQHLHHLAILTTANHNKQVLRSFKAHGFSEEDVWRAVMAEVVYQQSQRGAGRDPTNRKRKTLILPDLRCANFIAHLFDNVVPQPLGLAPVTANKGGRPAKHTSAAERQQAKRRRDRDRAEGAEEELRRRLVAGIVGAPVFDAHRYASKESGRSTRTTHGCFADLVASLRLSFEALAIADKDANQLILQGTLQASDQRNARGEPTRRAGSNIHSRSTLWIDVDGNGEVGGTIQPAHFQSIFPGLQMLMYSSFRHDASDTAHSRFRVVIPLSHAVGADTYEALHDLILLRIEARGWCRRQKDDRRKTRFHDVDVGKGHPTSIFYLPRKRLGAEGNAFFVETDGQPLDVHDCLSWPLRALVKEVPMVPCSEAQAPLDVVYATSKVEAAVQEYLTTGRGEQNSEINRLAFRLKAYGLSEDENEARLWSAAALSHSPAERKAQVPRVIRDLRQHWRNL